MKQLSQMSQLAPLFKTALNRVLKKQKLKQINLSLSSLCTANCIYCPSDRGQKLTKNIMPYEYAEKIITEISSKNFNKYHSIDRMSISENGEAFLNKDLVKILRLIKLRLPNIKVDIFTNFSAVTKQKLEIILKEKLIDTFACNIDGFTHSNYFNVKQLNLQNTQSKLMDFLTIRQKLNSEVPLTILVLTLHAYIHTVFNKLGFYPSKLKDNTLVNVPDDFLLIEDYYSKMIDPKKDRIIKSQITAWAEREKVNTDKIDYSNHSCRLLNRIRKEAFIAPDGTWYACCLDSNHQLALGNVIEHSINDIFFSNHRRELIKLLEKKKFADIGGPCKTVNCCEFFVN